MPKELVIANKAIEADVLAAFKKHIKDIAYAILKQIKWRFTPIVQSKENLIMKGICIIKWLMALILFADADGKR